jgi:DNA-binding MarR family transcriptional regulator
METVSEDGGDAVERARRQWQRVRPDLDTSPLDVVARLGRVERHLARSLDAFFAGRGLTREAWDVLASLRRQGPPFRLSPTELYRGLMRAPSAMTARLRHLEAAGLVRRVSDEADRRSVLVELTAAGLELVDALAADHLANEQRLLAPLGSQERAQLADLLRRLTLAYEAEGDDLTEPRRGRRRRH